MPTIIEQAQQLLSQGKAAQAEQLLTPQTNLEHPEHQEILSLLGHSLMQQQKFSAAIQVFDQSLTTYPPTASGYAELASALLSAGRKEAAERAYQHALELDPNYSDVWHLLGNLLMHRGEQEKAKGCFANAQKTDPFGHHFVTVQQHLDKGQFADAEQLCRGILEQHPNHSQALFILAKLAAQLGAFEEAISILNQGLRYSPFHISLYTALAQNFTELGYYEKAIDASNRLVTLDANNPQHWITLAGNLNHIGKNEQSLQAYNEAQKLAPELANIQLQKGHMLKILGQREACESAYLQCLKMEKINGAAYWALADLKSYPFSDSDISNMQSLLKNDKSPVGQASQAGFALGKAFEDRQDYQQAFDYYHQANALRPDAHFNGQEYDDKCQIVANAFNSTLLANHANPKPQGPTPIFIVGLPRSGSTLIEQILASHSAIEGTQELFNLPRLIRNINIEGGKQHKPYPAAMELFSPDNLRAYGQAYLEQTKVYRTDKPYFIDKAPPNFHNVGLIHMLMPDAIIIDARRHPLSTGFSNFKQHFAKGHEFSYDLANIGHYFNSYLKLMDHWDTVLPGKVLCMQYETLVQDTESQIRVLLAHCQLPFEQACVDFHQNKRAVRTSSSEQVRQPMNTKGMMQWRPFEGYLGPLKQALGEETLARFSAFE
ncbi:MAG: tetratricopeptide (TPR) repeat protein [Phenylobacterium sp.]|jgi:tetratricopeptide (TPR) repeat protein